MSDPTRASGGGGEPRALAFHTHWGEELVVIGDGLPEILAVVPVEALVLGGELVPTGGTWDRRDDGARFRPRFPVVPGTEFALLGRSDAAEAWAELARIPAPGTLPVRTTSVESIHPQVEDVPANILRFAVTFSGPMEQGTAVGRVHLRDADGADIAGVIFESLTELWDRDGRRLTVLLEPGRIKRGLQPNAQAGAPLREGQEFSFVVDGGIRDAAGAELVAGATRSYRVTAPIRSRVDPADWDVSWPAQPVDPVIVRFDRPLDRALTLRCLRIADETGQPVPGAASLDSTGTVWTFVPASEATTENSRWALHIDTRLEDLAGNSVRRVFDRDLDEPEDASIDAKVVVLGHGHHIALKE